MGSFRFYHRIEIRYGDIDPQRHVNNARHFTFMEQARAHYLMALGLWSGEDFDQIGIIMAEQSCTYLRPISLRQEVEIGVCTERMGTKSVEMSYSIRDAQSQQELATGRSILVTYDYQAGKSVAIPTAWREIINGFESGAPSDENGAANSKVDIR
ncbi:MAG: acyl-CoA thioesterase [Anaerolineales bacterium]|nr:MAG: acyl-CoA thioesterase [Anaerolineales bacterium]